MCHLLQKDCEIWVGLPYFYLGLGNLEHQIKIIGLILIYNCGELQQHIFDTVIIYENIDALLGTKIVKPESFADSDGLYHIVCAGMFVSVFGKYFNRAVDHPILFLSCKVKKFIVHLYLRIRALPSRTHFFHSY